MAEEQGTNVTLTRRQFLQSTGLATLSLSLARLRVQPAIAGAPPAAAAVPAYRGTRLEVERIGATA